MAKCLSGRPKTVEKAQAIFMLWVELEAVDAFLVCHAFLFFFSCALFFIVFGVSIDIISSLSVMPSFVVDCMPFFI